MFPVISYFAGTDSVSGFQIISSEKCRQLCPNAGGSESVCETKTVCDGRNHCYGRQRSRIRRSCGYGSDADVCRSCGSGQCVLPFDTFETANGSDQLSRRKNGAEIKDIHNKRHAVLSVIIFILATAFIVFFGSFDSLRPAFVIDGETVRLGMSAIIEIVMLSAAALILLLTRTDVKPFCISSSIPSSSNSKR